MRYYWRRRQCYFRWDSSHRKVDNRRTATESADHHSRIEQEPYVENSCDNNPEIPGFFSLISKHHCSITCLNLYSYWSLHSPLPSQKMFLLNQWFCNAPLREPKHEQWNPVEAPCRFKSLRWLRTKKWPPFETNWAVNFRLIKYHKWKRAQLRYLSTMASLNFAIKRTRIHLGWVVFLIDVPFWPERIAAKTVWSVEAMKHLLKMFWFRYRHKGKINEVGGKELWDGTTVFYCVIMQALYS